MSKNPAWNAYNETVRKLNDEYEETVRPLRKTLGTEITQTVNRFDEKINPLVYEKKTLIENLKLAYAEAVGDAEVKRRKAVNVARDVLNAELSSAREEAAA